MLQEGLYTISEIKAFITEGNDFSPKFGKNVQKDNAKNNDKAVDDIMKETDKLEKQAKKEKSKTNSEYIQDLNKTTLDVDFAFEPSKEYKDRVEAQVKGFPSKQNMENSKITDNKSLDFEGNKKFYNKQTAKSKIVNDKETDFKHSGLQSRELPKENFKNQTLYNENKTMKRLHYKNTKFLSEAQMLSKIPEDYKTDGNVFLMKDATGAEFIVECTIDDNFKFAKFNVTNKPSKEAINEEFERMQKLYEYKSSDYNVGTTNESRGNENSNISEMLQTVKKLKEQK